ILASAHVVRATGEVATLAIHRRGARKATKASARIGPERPGRPTAHHPGVQKRELSSPGSYCGSADARDYPRIIRWRPRYVYKDARSAELYLGRVQRKGAGANNRAGDAREECQEGPDHFTAQDRRLLQEASRRIHYQGADQVAHDHDSQPR